MKECFYKTISSNKKLFFILLFVLILVSAVSSFSAGDTSKNNIFLNTFFTLGEVFAYIFLILFILDLAGNIIEKRFSASAKIKSGFAFVAALFIYGITLIYDYTMWSDKEQAKVNKTMIASVKDRCQQIDKVSLYEEDGYYHFRCGNVLFVDNEWKVKVEDEPELSYYLMHK